MLMWECWAACVFGVTTDGREAIRGILVGVAAGTVRESYGGTFLRSEDDEEALCKTCWPEGGSLEWRF